MFFGIYETVACCISRLVLWWKLTNAKVNLSFEMSREYLSVNASKKVFKQQWNTCTN